MTQQGAAHAHWNKVFDVKVLLVVHESALTNVKHCRAALQQLNDMVSARYYTTPTGLAAVKAAEESFKAAELAMRNAEAEYNISLSQEGCGL